MGAERSSVAGRARALGARAEALAREAERDPAIAKVLEEVRREIDLWRGYGGKYGYAFVLLRSMR